MTGTSLDSAAGIAIQGTTVRADGTFSPRAGQRLTAGPRGFELVVPPGSVTLVTVA